MNPMKNITYVLDYFRNDHWGVRIAVVVICLAAFLAMVFGVNLMR